MIDSEIYCDKCGTDITYSLTVISKAASDDPVYYCLGCALEILENREEKND